MKILICILAIWLSSCNQKSEPQTQVETAVQPAMTVAPAIVDRILLANGGVIEGKIVHETSEMVRIEWEGSVVGFGRDEIESIERGTTQKKAGGLHVPTFESEEDKKNAWPASADHQIFLKNGERFNGRIVRKEGDVFIVHQKFEEGGSIEIEIPEVRVEKIRLWRPSELDHKTRLSDWIAKFPKMQFTQKGYYVILTSETETTDLKFYLKMLDHIYNDFLIHFFGLYELDYTPDPLDVLIFGTHQEFTHLLAEVGYNARSNPLGFYHFNVKKLVFYNVRSGQEVQSAIKQVHEQQSYVAGLKQRVGTGNYGGGIGGQLEQASEAVERDELRLLGRVTSQLVKIIRHEGGHQLFHLTGVTPIEVYSGGWLIEGLAVYCETEPIGMVHEERLMQLRFEEERSELMPLEYLLNFKRGTEMHHLDPLYANIAYAESWAFVYFLMQNYKDAFYGFLKEMRVQNETYDSHGELALLEKHLEKDIKTIEQEFFAFVRGLIERDIDEKTYQDYRLQLVQAA